MNKKHLIVVLVMRVIFYSLLLFVSILIYKIGYWHGYIGKPIATFAKFMLIFLSLGSLIIVKNGFVEGKLLSSIIWFFVSILSMIFWFGAMYSEIGLLDSEGHILHNINEGIYFSIATWTTLAYGDFRLPSNLRFVVSIEAWLGYVYMGIFVALLVILLTKKSK